MYIDIYIYLYIYIYIYLYVYIYMYNNVFLCWSSFTKISSELILEKFCSATHDGASARGAAQDARPACSA